MHSIVVRAALLAALAVTVTTPAAAQSQTKLEGVINDYSGVANATPWHIGFTGDPITVLITGDPATVRYSNIAITFGGTGSTSAAGHFDAAPVNGVVTSQLP